MKKKDTSFNFAQSSVGIEEYVNPTLPGFHAIIKARFSDFIVREIDMQGNVVTLKDLGVPKHALQNRTRALQCQNKNDDVAPLATMDTCPLEVDPDITADATTAADATSTTVATDTNTTTATESFEWTESQVSALESMLKKVYPSTTHMDEMLCSIRSLFDQVGRNNHIHLPVRLKYAWSSCSSFIIYIYIYVY